MDGLTRAERYRGALLGLAAGDALGTTLEFRSPGTFTPITDIVGGGPFGLSPGQWTDDTSMALCLAESLVTCEGHDAADQMQRYVRWRDEGYLSSTGACFDVGSTVSSALSRFRRTGEPYSGSTDSHSAGNGSLMRLAPVPLAFAHDVVKAAEMAAASSRTTHGAREAVDACRYFAALLVGALDGASKDELLGGTWTPAPRMWMDTPLSAGVARIAAGSFRARRPPQVRGTGYVVDALEAALWAIDGASDFREACLRGVNLGDDADTTGAIVGQLAGALWGVGGDAGIPTEWMDRIAMRARIEELADQLLALAERLGGEPGTTSSHGADESPTSDVAGRTRPAREGPAGVIAALPSALGDRAFWVRPPHFIAGAYPGDVDLARHNAKLAALIELRVTRVISLMREDEVSHGGTPFRPYVRRLKDAGVAVERHAIRDVSTPSVEAVTAVLDAIDAEIARGGTVYLHCWGGRGRTGVIVGCWLVRHGHATQRNAVAALKKLRRRCSDADVPAPDTAEQIRRIELWRDGGG